MGNTQKCVLDRGCLQIIVPYRFEPLRKVRPTLIFTSFSLFSQPTVNSVGIRNNTFLRYLMKNAGQQIVFGELLSQARLDLGLSRAEVARETGISENSLIRYEKAGLDKDGQYPPGPKLAKLCLHLDIPAARAMWSCLSAEDYKIARADTGISDDVVNHPHSLLVSEQLEFLEKENRTLSTALRYLIDDEGDLVDEEFAQQMKAWIKSSVHPLLSGFQEFEKRMVAMGIFVPMERTVFSIARSDSDQWQLDRRNLEFDPEKTVGVTWINPAQKTKERLKELITAIEETEVVHRRNMESRRDALEERKREFSQRVNEDPDQSPNSPGSSENK
mgnify:CR=1 FL=1